MEILHWIILILIIGVFTAIQFFLFRNQTTKAITSVLVDIMKHTIAFKKKMNLHQDKQKKECILHCLKIQS